MQGALHHIGGIFRAVKTFVKFCKSCEGFRLASFCSMA